MSQTVTRPAAGTLCEAITDASQRLTRALMALSARFGEQADAVELAALAARMQVARLEAAQAACREQLARHAEAVSQAQQMLEESVADAAADAADLAEVLAHDAADEAQNGKQAEGEATLPELSAEEQAASDALPADFIGRLLRGERPLVPPAARPPEDAEEEEGPEAGDEGAGRGAAPARRWPEAPIREPGEVIDLADGEPERPSLPASSERIEADGTAQAREVTAAANAPLLGVPAAGSHKRGRKGR